MLYTTLMTVEDLHYVLNNLWERGVQELERCEVNPKDFAFLTEYVIGCSTESYTLKNGDDNQPIAVFGGMPLDGGGLAMFFFATDALARMGREATLYLRDYTRDWKRNNPDKPLEVWSMSGHSEASRWFKVLGFEHYHSKGLLHRYKCIVKTKLTAAD